MNFLLNLFIGYFSNVLFSELFSFSMSFLSIFLINIFPLFIHHYFYLFF